MLKTCFVLLRLVNEKWLQLTETEKLLQTINPKWQMRDVKFKISGFAPMSSLHFAPPITLSMNESPKIKTAASTLSARCCLNIAKTLPYTDSKREHEF